MLITFKIILLVDMLFLTAAILIQKSEGSDMSSITGGDNGSFTSKRRKYTDKVLTNITIVTGTAMMLLDLILVLLGSK